MNIMSSSSNFHKNVMEVQGAFLTVQVSMNFRGLLILFFQDTFRVFRNIVAFGLKMEKRSKGCTGMVDKKRLHNLVAKSLTVVRADVWMRVSVQKNHCNKQIYSQPFLDFDRQKRKLAQSCI